MDFIIPTSIFITLIFVIYIYLQRVFKYWENAGLCYIPPSIPFGNTKKLMQQKIGIGAQFQEFYNYFKEKGLTSGGIYFGLTPTWVVVDHNLLKQILVKDFTNFMDRGVYHNNKLEPLAGHLFHLCGEKWKFLRSKLTPTFTSGKMKMMFPTLLGCTVDLKDVLSTKIEAKEAIDIKEVLSSFTIDVIGSCAFGIECNCLKNPNAAFRVHALNLFKSNSKSILKRFITFALPTKLLDFLKITLLDKEARDFFMNAIKETVDYRELNNVQRNDFMHLLLQLKNRGVVNNEDGKVMDNIDQNDEKITLNDLAAQAFVFYAAGFETTSTTMTFALYEIALNPDIQEKLRNEINKVLETYKGKITYEGMMEMSYMENIIYETLRKYPPGQVIPRICTQDYKIPGSSVTIKNGCKVMIPVYALHHDPENFPNPEIFYPDRFNEENKGNIKPYTFLPFGEGPRVCIGARFAMMEMKIGILSILRHHKLNLCNKSSMVFDTKALLTAAPGGAWLDMKKIE